MYTISQNLLIKTLAYICQGVLSLEVSRYCGYNFDNYRSLNGVFMNSDIFYLMINWPEMYFCTFNIDFAIGNFFEGGGGVFFKG